MAERKKRSKGLSRALLAAALLLLALLFDSNCRIVTDVYTVPIDGLPEGFSGARILQISDVHGAKFGKENARLLAQAAALQPDYILLTGDLADREGQQAPIRTLVEGLVTIAPVYFVTGNHDWTCGWTEELLSLLEESGVTVLQNDWVTLTRGGDSLVLAGVDDPNGRADMMTPIELIDSIVDATGAPPTLLMNHRNNRLGMYDTLDIPLVFSGHAHGGLMRLPGLGGLFSREGLLPEHTEGLCQSGDTTMVVSRGLGNIRGTLRLFNNPQLICVELVAK